MTIEDRLRRAIEDRTAAVDVDERAGLERIAGRLSTPGDDGMDRRTSRFRWLLAAAAVVLVAAVAGGLLLLGRDGQDRVDISDRPGGAPTTAPPATDDTTGTTAPDATTGTTATDDTTDTTAPDDAAGEEAPEPPPPPANPPETGSSGDVSDQFARQVIWPRPSSDVRFDDPGAAVRSFALYYARFDDPVIGEFQAADSHSGEVIVRARPGGPETVVRVAVSPRGQWFVTGAGSPDITVDRPRPGATLTCPLATSGTALAFEGTVQVRIDAYQPDGRRVEMGRGFVTGSGAPPAGPFSEQIACTPRSGVEDSGVVAFWTDDASGDLDGPLQIVVVPVGLP